MGISYNVEGVKPPDAKWKKMKAAWVACEDAGISVPDEIYEFFNGETPDEKGVVEQLGGMYGKRHQCVALIEDDNGGGFEVDLKKLPDDVTLLRFRISC